MSLNFDTTKCNPPIPTDENDTTLREVLIFATMFLGISDLTEKNAAEFYARIHLNELAFGGMRNRSLEGGGFEPVLVTPAEVRRWIGLHTNASTLTRAQFLKKMEFALKDYATEYNADSAKTE